MIQENDRLLTSFKVTGLHGDRDIEIDFPQKTRIIVASNGTGKTSLINMLYHFLSRNFQRLSQYDFETLEAHFSDGRKIEIHLSDLESIVPNFSNNDLPQVTRKVLERVPANTIVQLLELYKKYPDLERIRHIKDFSEVRIELRIPSIELLRSLSILEKYNAKFPIFDIKSASISNEISKAFPYEILFLPTYRRVEEDLSNLGLSMEDGPSKLSTINFGMSDVRKRFDSITRAISESSLIFYQQMSGRMLDELMNGLNAETLDYNEIAKIDTITPLLKRFTNSISAKTQESIKELIRTDSIRENKYRPLAYIISRLVEIDKERQNAESNIIDFCNVVNSYFEDKYISFNNDAMTITVLNGKTDRSIDLDKLSSGEKQLISLFSQIYLGGNSNLAVLFDEPELSLSIDWQQKVLPDILASKRCQFLLAATHSPFIFDNGLDTFAQPITVTQRELVGQ